MADDLDVESWLEAPYKPEAAITPQKNSARDPQLSNTDISRHGVVNRHERDSKEYSSRRRSRSRDRSHRSSRHRSRSYDKEKDRRSRHSSRRSRSPSRSSRHKRERSRDRSHHSRDIRRSKTPPKAVRKERSPSPVLSEHDRDQRTVFVIQLAARLTTSELRDFFSKVGRVRDARIVSDRNSRRSKGVGYVEFYDIKSVEPALALTGHKLLGIPVIVQNTEAEKNRIAEANAAALRCASSSSLSSHRLYIGNLQYNLTEDDLKQLFEPFGAIDLIEIPKDLATGRGRGYAFIQYRIPDDSKIALTQMNGFELGGRPIRVGMVSDKAGTATSLDDPDGGMVLNSHSRAELMKKLARDGEMEMIAPSSSGIASSVSSPLVSRSVILENMFDPDEETEPNWERLLEDEVEAECTKHGRVSHIHLEGDSKGTIYVKFDGVSAAQKAINALHGRWFGGRQVAAKCIPDAAYNTRFPRAT